jgi:predicted metal-binding membrane protein
VRAVSWLRELRRFDLISSPLQTAVLSRRDRVIISSCLVLLTALAWTYLVHLEHQMSAAMTHDRTMADMGMTMDMPWNAADVFFTFAMWAVMMVGMMTASAAPVMLLFAGMHRGRGAQRAPRAVIAFSAGYLCVWTAFSAGAALAQWALHQAAMLSPAMTSSSARLSGAILIAAGVYQLTPFKGTCLTHCRSPLGFLMSHWREGPAGALRMGIDHGTYCLGCCWALMCVLFVVGVMNLVWVAAMTLFVLVEKIGPAGALVARVAGVAMIACGALVWTASL